MKKTPALLGVLALLALGAGVFWYVESTAPIPVPALATPPPAPGDVVVEEPRTNFLAPLVQPDPSTALPRSTPATPPPLHLSAGLLPWEGMILAVLQDPAASGTRGQRLLALLPTLPEEAYAPATEQALQWIRDPEYVSTALPLLLDVHTHGAVQTELFRDLMERPDTVALPSLLSIARTPGHPYAETALHNLELVVGQDHGTNWEAWETAVREKLSPR